MGLVYGFVPTVFLWVPQSLLLTSSGTFLFSQTKHMCSLNDDGGDCNGLFFCRNKYFYILMKFAFPTLFICYSYIFVGWGGGCLS